MSHSASTVVRCDIRLCVCCYILAVVSLLHVCLKCEIRYPPCPYIYNSNNESIYAQQRNGSRKVREAQSERCYSHNTLKPARLSKADVLYRSECDDDAREAQLRVWRSAQFIRYLPGLDSFEHYSTSAITVFLTCLSDRAMALFLLCLPCLRCFLSLSLGLARNLMESE